MSDNSSNRIIKSLDIIYLNQYFLADNIINLLKALNFCKITDLTLFIDLQSIKLLFLKYERDWKD